MFENVEGYKDVYVKLAELVPQSYKTLLDLGGGTGLKLKETFKNIPDLSVNRCENLDYEGI